MKKILVATALLILMALPVKSANPLLEPMPLNAEIADQMQRHPDGWWYVEIGDMKILVDDGTKALSRYTKWPGGVVYYQFSANLNTHDDRPMSGDGDGRRAAFRAAAMEWEATVTGLTFVEGTGSGNYILVQSADGNSSYVGMTPWAGQEMNIYNWNYRFIIAHEIGHALSLLHEQSRPDRDAYITVNLENIQDYYEDQYERDNSGFATQFGLYDYGSVMHYGRCSFSISPYYNCSPYLTMDAKAAGAASVGMTVNEANNAMGNRDDLTSTDIAAMRVLYPGAAGQVFDSCFENGRTNAWSAVVGESGAKRHDVFTTGSPLQETHDPRAAEVCTIDPSCCTTAWDARCVDLALASLAAPRD
jgi:hypothetical protein